MPRAFRADYAGEIYHALNRGNARNDVFFKEADFEAFERVVSEGLEKYPVDLICYQWMKKEPLAHGVVASERQGHVGLSWLGHDDPYPALPCPSNAAALSE